MRRLAAVLVAAVALTGAGVADAPAAKDPGKQHRKDKRKKKKKRKRPAVVPAGTSVAVDAVAGGILELRLVAFRSRDGATTGALRGTFAGPVTCMQVRGNAVGVAGGGVLVAVTVDGRGNAVRAGVLPATGGCDPRSVPQLLPATGSGTIASG